MLTERTLCCGGRGRPNSLEPAAVACAGSTRWRTALSHVGSIVVLAVGSACASHTPDAGPTADGPYIAARPEAFEGRVIGEGHCVDFVQAAAGAPRATAWREGAEVRGNPHIARGTAIATFESDGRLHERVRQSRGDLSIPGRRRHLGLRPVAGPARAQAPDPLRGRERCQVGQQEQRWPALRCDRVMQLVAGREFARAVVNHLEQSELELDEEARALRKGPPLEPMGWREASSAAQRHQPLTCRRPALPSRKGIAMGRYGRRRYIGGIAERRPTSGTQIRAPPSTAAAASIDVVWARAAARVP